MRKLPPLNALRAFEAAARHLSFTRAAEELFVTQAAISHQVKGLEEWLGLDLFRRRNRSLLLTDPGQTYLPVLRDALDAIDGLGVALGRSVLVADALASGRLVKPFDLSLHADFAYYLVCADRMVDRPKVRAFGDWLFEEAQGTAQGTMLGAAQGAVTSQMQDKAEGALTKT